MFLLKLKELKMLEWIVDLIAKLFILIGLCFLPFVVMSAWYYIYYRFIKKTMKPIRKIISDKQRILR